MHVMSSDMGQFVLVGLGEILWDMLPSGKQLGGAPANFAYHAQALGGRGIVVSCVGDDELGRDILARLASLGLEQTCVATDAEHPTGTVTVQLDDQGKPDYVIHENVAWDFIPTTEELLKLAGTTDAVCFGSLCQRSAVSSETVREFLRATRSDCVRVFDINIRQSYYSKDVVETLLELASVLKLNDEELPVVAGLLGISSGETEMLARLSEVYNLKVIALTKGVDGSRLYSQSADSVHPGFSAEIADTVGAGDAFTAALTLGLLRGDDLDKINANANRLAAFVCSQKGATPKLPDSLLAELV